MCIVLVCMRYVKKFGCHYNQSGVLKIEIPILLRLARFQNLGTPPNITRQGFLKFYRRAPSIWKKLNIVMYFSTLIPKHMV